MIRNSLIHLGGLAKQVIKSTGQIIEEARKNANITQEELAARIGTNKSYISRVETGRTEPKVSTFYRIIAALGLTIELTPAV